MQLGSVLRVGRRVLWLLDSRPLRGAMAIPTRWTPERSRHSLDSSQAIGHDGHPSGSALLRGSCSQHHRFDSMSGSTHASCQSAVRFPGRRAGSYLGLTPVSDHAGSLEGRPGLLSQDWVWASTLAARSVGAWTSVRPVGPSCDRAVVSRMQVVRSLKQDAAGHHSSPRLASCWFVTASAVGAGAEAERGPHESVVRSLLLWLRRIEPCSALVVELRTQDRRVSPQESSQHMRSTA